MKLIIQIPCLNEAETLPLTLSHLPRSVPGVSSVEWMVIDDGSTDNTAEVARGAGVDHIVRHPYNRGLAAAFQTGLNACLQLGADVIVNTDADNQYPGEEVPRLAAPVVAGQADMVIADRQTHQIAHFSPLKKLLQWGGSAVVRAVSGTAVPDAPSGFRALSREAALRLQVSTTYTYTLETIIQAGKKNLKIVTLPILTNPTTRESRLVKSQAGYVWRSAGTILRLFVLYEPLRTFGYMGLPFFLGGSALWLRYLWLWAQEGNLRGAHLQSVIVGGTLLLMAILVWCLGLLSDLLAANRKLLDANLYYLKQWVHTPGARSSSTLAAAPVEPRS